MNRTLGKGPLLAFLLVASVFSGFQAFAQATVTTNTILHTTLSQTQIVVNYTAGGAPLATGLNATGTAAQQIALWTVKIDPDGAGALPAVAVTVTSVIVAGLNVVVTFDATALNGVAFIKPTQTMTLAYGGGAGAGAIQVVPFSGANFVPVIATTASLNNSVFNCGADLIFFNQGDFQSVDQCSPVVMNFHQFQYKLSLRARNSSAFLLANLESNITWGDATSTLGLPFYISDLTGAASPNFIDNTGFTGSNPAVVVTQRPTHNYPAANPGDCSFDCSFTPLYFTVGFCPGLTQTNIFKTYDTDNANSGALSLQPSVVGSDKVCLGSNVNMQFSDNTLLNCRAAIEPIVPNDQTRNIRIIYGSTNYAVSGNIPDIRVTLPAIVGGAIKTLTNNNPMGTLTQPGNPAIGIPVGGFAPINTGAADFNGVITLNSPVNAATLTAYMGQLTTTLVDQQAVGQRFYIRIDYWDVCNIYNNLTPTNPAPVSIENFVEIVSKPAALTTTGLSVCFANPTVGTNFVATGGVAGRTAVNWYKNFASVGTATKMTNPNGTNSLSFPTTSYNAANGAIGQPYSTNNAGGKYFSVWATQVVGATNSCESNPVEIVIYQQPDITANAPATPVPASGNTNICNNGPGEVYNETTAPPTKTITANSGGGTNGAAIPFATQNLWSLGAFPATVSLAPVSGIGNSTTVTYAIAPEPSPSTTNSVNVRLQYQVTNVSVVSPVPALPAAAAVATYSIASQQCVNTNVPLSVTVFGTTLGGAVTPTPKAICDGSSTGTLTLSGHRGAILKWQRKVGAAAPVDIANTTTTFSEVPASGPNTYQYWAVVQNNTSGGPCAAQNSTPAVITVNAVPSQPTITLGAGSTGGFTICQDGTQQVVLKANDASGVATRFDFYRGVTLVQSGASSTFTVNTVAQSGSYTVIGFGPGTTFCQSPASAPKAVLVNPLPIAANPSGGGPVCAGSPAPDISWLLTGTAPFNLTYTTSFDGAHNFPAYATNTFTIFAPTAAGTYQITSLTDANGCVATSMGIAATVTISPTAPPAVSTVVAGVAVCDVGAGTVPSPVTVTVTPASVQNYNVLYKIGATTQPLLNINTTAAGVFTISPTYAQLGSTPGTYVLQITSIINTGTGCAGSVLGPTANVIVNPKPAAPTGPVGATACSAAATGALIKVNDPGATATIQWFSNAAGTTAALGVTGGTHGETFTPTSNATFTYFAYTFSATGPTFCQSNTGTAVVHTQDLLPAAAAGGPDQLTLCGTTATMAATAPTNGGIGTWTITGTGTITTPGSRTTTVTGLTQSAPGGAPVSVTMHWTVVSALGICSSSSDDVTLTVNALPTKVDPAPHFCEDVAGGASHAGVDLTTFNAAVTSGTTVTWFKDAVHAVPIIPANTLQVVNNTTAKTFYFHTTSAIPCGNDGQITFTVDPQPTATVPTLASRTFCEDVQGSGSHASVNLIALYNPQINGAATITWYPTLADAQALTNQIPPAAAANFTVTVGMSLIARVVGVNTCVNFATVPFVVNPLPQDNLITGNAIDCSSLTAVKIYQVSAALNAFGLSHSYNWNVNGAGTNFEVFNGVGFVTSNNYTVTNTSFLILLRFPNAGTFTFNVSETIDGCTGNAVSKVVNISGAPAPLTFSSAPTDLCKGSLGIDYILTGGAHAGSNYTWTVVGGTVVGPSSGAIAQITVNWGALTVPQPSVSVTEANASGCAGSPVSVNVFLYDIPVMTSGTTATICSGSAPSSQLTFSALLGGAPPVSPITFNWKAVSVPPNVTGVATNQTGSGNIALALTNVSGVSGIVTFEVTPVENDNPNPPNCTTTPQTIFITVMPQPVVDVGQVKTICSGAAVNYKILLAPLGLPATTKLSWPAPVMSAGPAQGSASIAGGVLQSNAVHLTDVLVNTTASPITATYSISALDGLCASPTPVPVIITINPEPAVTAIPNVNVCSGANIAAINFTASTGGGEAFNWTNTNAAVGLPLAGVGNIASYTAPVNTTGVPIVGTVTVTATKSGCTSAGANAKSFTITIKPEPVMTAPVSNISVCSGGAIANIVFLANTGGGETFDWTNSNTAIGIGASGSGNIPGYTAPINISGADLVGTIVVTATFNGCQSSGPNSKTFTITIKPEPVVAVVPNASICSGASVSAINFTANTGGGETFNWTNTNTAIGLSASGSGNIGGYVAPINTSGVDIVGTINVTATKNGCTSAGANAKSFTITIKAEPVVAALPNISVCSGTPIGAINFSANTAGGEIFNWANTNIAVGLPATGVGNIAAFTAPVNISGTDITGTIVVTATKNGCTSSGLNAKAFTITIKAEPVVAPVPNISVCSGATISAINFAANTGGGETFNWTNNNTAVGLAASGFGNIASYTAPINLTGADFVASVSVTATRNGCVSSGANAKTFTITVKAEPVVAVIPNVSVCSGDAIAAISFTANTGGGETFVWANNNIAVGLPASGTGNLSAWTAPVNVSGLNIVATVSVTAAKNGCTSTGANAKSFTITIKPEPVVAAIADVSVCSGSLVPAINFSANAGAGQVFNWTNTNVGVGLAASGVGSIPAYTAPVNITGSDIVATITVTASKNGCTSAGLNTQSFNITIKPEPVVDVVPNVVVCSGASISTISFSANTGGGEAFSWTNSNTAVGLPATGVGDIATYTAPTNISGSAITATLVVSASINGCTSTGANSKTFTITINPEPVVSPVLNVSVCSGGAIPGISFTANTGGGETFNWTNTNAAIGLGLSGAGSIAAYTAPVNNTGADLVGFINVTATKDGCTSAGANARSFTITVKAEPIVNAIANTSVCSGQVVPGINFSANTAGGETFNWTNTNSSIGIATSGVGNIPAYAGPVNISGSDIVGTISVLATKNGCTSTSPQVFTITIRPEPVVTVVPNVSVCSGAAIPTISFTANTGGGESFIWSNTNTAIGLAAGGLGDIPGYTAPINISGSDIVGSVTVTATKNGCTSTGANSKTFTITIKAEPVVAAIANVAACSASAVSAINFSANTGGGESFNWTNTNPAIGLSASGSGNIPTYTAPLNTSGAPIIGTLTVSATKNGCTSTGANTKSFTITINPEPVVTPVGNISVCPGSPIAASAFSANTAGGEVFNWTNTNTGIGIPASGTGDIGAFVAPVNISGAAVVGTIVVTATKNGCTSTPANSATYTITIKPEPVVNSIPNAGVCSGATLSTIAFAANTGGGEVFNWTNSNTAIGLPASGAGNIASYVAPLNTTGLPIVGTINVTATINGCVSTGANSKSFTITIKPEPVVAAIPNVNVCSGGSISAIAFSANTGGGETFNWTNTNAAIGLATVGSGNIAAYTAPVNTSSADFVGTIVVTASANGCTSAGANSKTFTITVKQEPVMKPALAGPIVICSDSPTNITLATNGVSIGAGSYDVALVGVQDVNLTGTPTVGLGLPDTAIKNDAFGNVTAAPISIQYRVTPHGTNLCIGAPFIITVTVNPKPVLFNPGFPAVCSSNLTFTNPVNVVLGTNGISVNAASYTLTNELYSTNGGTTFAPALPANFTPFGGANAIITTSGDINLVKNDLFNNVSTGTVIVRYVITPKGPGPLNCVGSSLNYDVAINPEPIMVPGSAAVCSGIPTGIVLGTAVGSAPITGYDLTSIFIANPLLVPAGTNKGLAHYVPNNFLAADTYTNTTGGALHVIYTIVPYAGTCKGDPQTVDLTVNPAPAVASNLNKTLCTGEAIALNLSKDPASVAVVSFNIVGVTFPGLTAGGTNAVFPASAKPANYLANDTYVNPTSAPLTVTYSVQAVSVAPCTGPTKDIVITIEPTITVTPTNSAPDICSGSATNINLKSVTTPTAGNITFDVTVPTVAFVTGYVDRSSVANTPVTGFTIADVLVNSDNVPHTVVYQITPTASGAKGGIGCSGNMVPVSVIVEPRPRLVTSAVSQTVCEGTPTNITLTTPTYPPTGSPAVGTMKFELIAVSNPGGVTGVSALNTQFSVGAILADVLSNPTLTGQVVTYTLQPKIVGGSGCVGANVDVVITVNPLPDLNVPPPTAVCSQDPFSISLTSAYSNVINQWPTPVVISGAATGFSGGAGDLIFQSIKNTGSVPAIIRYIVTPKLNGCFGTPLQIDVTVNPIADFAVPPPTQNVCFNTTMNVPLTSNVAGTIFSWTVDTNFSGAVSGSGPVISQLFANPAGDFVTYHITATGPGATACASQERVMTVVAAPQMNVSFLNPASNDLCLGSKDFLQISLEGQAPFKFTYSATTASGTVILPPLTNVGNFKSITIQPTDTTVYKIESVSDAFGCVYPGPFPSVRYRVGTTNSNLTVVGLSSACSPFEVSFKYDNQAYTDYVWRWGDGSPDSTPVHSTVTTNGVIVKHTFTNSSPTGQFKPKVVLQASLPWGCFTSSQQQIIVNPTIITNVFPDKTEMCSGETVFFTNQSFGVSPTGNTWTVKDGSGAVVATSALKSPNFQLTNNTATNPEVFDVIYQATSTFNCPAAPVTTQITVYRGVTASINNISATEYVGGSSTWVFGNTSTVHDDAQFRYDWDFGSESSSSLPPLDHIGDAPDFRFTVTYTSPGPRDVVLTVTNRAAELAGLSCSSTFTLPINVLLPPLVAAFKAVPGVSCYPSKITVTENTSTGDIFEWRLIDGNGKLAATSNVPFPEFDVNIPGKYTLFLRVSSSDSGQPMDAPSQEFTIYDKPLASFDVRPDVVYVPDTEMNTFNFSFGATDYIWDFGDNGTSSEFQPVYTYKIEGNYTVTLIAQNNHGPDENGVDVVCADTLTRTVLAKQGGLAKVPNAFTPNTNGPNDGTATNGSFNDVFLPIVKGVEDFNMQIYDRWGNLIFESNSATTGWNGYYNNSGHLMPSGVYVFKLTVRLSDNQRSTQIGDVTMIR